MAPLPLVGAQAVILGYDAFKSQAAGVQGFLNDIGRSAYRLEASTNGAFDGINRAVSAVEKSSARLAGAQAKLATAITSTYETASQKAQAASASIVASNNLQRDVIINNSRTQLANVVRDANAAATAEIAAAQRAAEGQAAALRLAHAQATAQARADVTTQAITIRQNAGAGPVGRSNATLEIAEVRRQAAEETAVRNAAQAAALRNVTVVRDARIAAANETRTGIINAERGLSNEVVRSTSQITTVANAAAVAQAAAAERAAAARIAAELQVAEATAAAEAAMQASIKATIAIIAGVSAALVGIFAITVAGATKAASDFESKMALIQGSAGATAAQMEQLKGAITDLKDTPTSINDLSEAMYALVTAGASIEEITGGALKGVNDLIIASGNRLSANTAATSISTAINAFKNYQKEGAAVADITDVITAAANKSNQSFESVGTAVQRSAGTLARSGVSLQEFGALTTIVGQQIRDGSTAGSALQRVFLDLQSPTEKQNKIMKQFGISLYDVNGNLRPTRDFILGLNEAFGEGAIAAGKLTRAQRDQALSSLFEQNAIRAVNAILDQGIDKFDEYSQTAKGAADAAVAPQLETAEAKYKVLEKSVNAAAIAFGTNFLPLLKGTIDGFNAFVTSIPAAELGNFAARIVEMGGALLQFVSNLAITKEGLLLTAGAITAAFLPAISAVIVGILSALAPIIALGTAFTIVALIFSQESENISNILKPLFDNIGGFFSQLAAEIPVAMEHIGTFFAKGWDAFVDVVYIAFGNQVTLIADGFQTISGLFQQFISFIAPIWKDHWKFILETALGPLGAIIKVLDDLSKVPGIENTPFAGMAEGIKDASKAIDDAVKGIDDPEHGIGATFKAVFDFAGPAATKFTQDVGEAFNGFKDRSAATFGKVGNDVSSLITQLQKLWEDAVNPHKVVLEAEVKDSPFTPGSHTQSTAPGFTSDPKALKDFQDALESLLKLARDTGQALDKLAKDAADKFADIASKAADAAEKASTEVNKSIREAVRSANEAISKLKADRALELATRSRQDALKAQTDAANVAHTIQLADEDHFHQRELDALQRAFDAEQKVREDAYKDAEDSLNRAHDRELEDDDIFYKSKQDALRRAFDERQALALKSFSEQQDADYRAFKDRAARDELEYQHKADLAKSILDVQKKLNEDLRSEEKDRQQKLEEENTRHLETLQNAQNQQIIDAENRRHAQQTGRINDSSSTTIEKARTEASEHQQELNEKYAEDVRDYERRQKLDEQDRLFRAQQEADLAAFRKQQETEVLAYQEAARVEDLARKRAIDDAEFARKKAQELEFDNFRKQLEAESLARKQAQEDAEIAHNRERDEQERAYKREEDAKQRALEDQLAQETLARRIAEANAERDAKIAALNAELAEKLRVIERERQQEIANYLRDMHDRLQIIRQEFLDKLPDILAKGGEAIVPIVNGIIGAIDAQLAAVEGAAIRTAGAVTMAGVASVGTIFQAVGAASMAVASSIRTAQQITEAAVHGSPGTNTGRVYQDAPQGQSFDLVPQYAEGGWVKAPTGKPQIAVVHGGEFIIPASALRASTMNTGGSTTNKSTTYQVNASYGQTQDVGSIRQDMAALVAVTRQ